MAYATEKGQKEGFDKGIEQGVEQEKIRVAKNMLDLNFELDIIAKTTGLSEDAIIKLK